jgi:hypothetical protein
MVRLTLEDRIITDAAVRRFQCQRAYLRAHAGLRWMNSRNSILRGQKPNASHFAGLQAVDSTLRMVRHTKYIPSPGSPLIFEGVFERRYTHVCHQELLAISDAHVENTLRSQDASQGKWLAEDPSLAQMQQILMSR